MTERGERGVRGIQGPLGGQGIEGPTGPEGPEGPEGAGGGRGEQGRRGERGRLPLSLAVIYLITALVISLVLAFMGWQIIQNGRLADDGRKAHNALCAFRAGLDRQIDSSKAYLADVQQSRRQRVPGITDNDIRASIRRQQTTIDSLSKSGLDCETKGAP